ncbi:MAG: hypothetical protein ACKO37_06280 [Vampirovibrionales bacterium]
MQKQRPFLSWVPHRVSKPLVLSDATYFATSTPKPLPAQAIVDSFMRHGYMTLKLDTPKSDMARLKATSKPLLTQWRTLSAGDKHTLPNAVYPYQQGTVLVHHRSKENPIQSFFEGFVGIVRGDKRSFLPFEPLQWRWYAKVKPTQEAQAFEKQVSHHTKKVHDTLRTYFNRLHEGLTQERKGVGASETMTHFRLATYLAPPKGIPSASLLPRAWRTQTPHQDRSYMTVFLDETSPGTHLMQTPQGADSSGQRVSLPKYHSVRILPVAKDTVHIFPGKAWMKKLQTMLQKQPSPLSDKTQARLKAWIAHFNTYHAGGLRHQDASRTTVFAFLQPNRLS